MVLRDQIYAKEAASILRIVTTYRVVLESQVYRFFPGKEPAIKKLLRHLLRQGRIVFCAETLRYAASDECLRQADPGMVRAIWVLIDFIDKVEFHTNSDFPVKIVFFADSEMYEIIHVPIDSEMLISQVLSQKGHGEATRIVLVDDVAQIGNIKIPSVAGFCTVNTDGFVQYYTFQ